MRGTKQNVFSQQISQGFAKNGIVFLELDRIHILENPPGLKNQ